ncbi:MAG: hypothetical protein JWP97_5163 [Labilithrix sp.]|nr:hypothetical protein [Labilithrix sp.]
MSTHPLRDVQLWMVSAITGPAPDAATRDIERFVKAGPRMSAEDRFDVYRLGYHARLVECLVDDYPVLSAMLGEALFGALCRAYVDRHPSTSPNLNAFGQNLPSFCREAELRGEHAGSFAELRAFAADLATLEWALVEVLHAECPPPVELSALATLPPESWSTARFVASDALRLHRFAYPVNEVFIANRMRDEVPAVPAPRPTAVAVYRKDSTLWRMDLSPEMLLVLEPLVAGQSLGEALGALEETVTDPAALEQIGTHLMVWFREWVAAGFFTNIAVG